MSSGTPPQPNPAQDYAKGIKTYLKFLPQLLQGEQKARQQYDPQRIEEQLALQGRYGALQAGQQRTALAQIDPQGVGIRGQLGTKITSDLDAGYSLPPEFAQQLTSQIRGAEAARGNDLGNAAISAEGLYKGKAMLDLYQQHLQNAGNFLAGPTPEQQLLAVSPVTADRSAAYVNPSAGYQGQAVGAGNYQNLLAQWQASSGKSGWGGATAGASSGASVGGLGGPYGAIGGALIGGVSGYFGGPTPSNPYSDKRLKNNIVRVGESPNGIGKYEFNYNGCKGRFTGAIAQDVLKIRPDAVTKDRLGWLKVNYDLIDVDFKELHGAEHTESIGRLLGLEVV